MYGIIAGLPAFFAGMVFAADVYLFYKIIVKARKARS
jgi:hypothetical protein